MVVAFAWVDVWQSMCLFCLKCALYCGYNYSIKWNNELVQSKICVGVDKQ